MLDLNLLGLSQGLHVQRRDFSLLLDEVVMVLQFYGGNALRWGLINGIVLGFVHLTF